MEIIALTDKRIFSKEYSFMNVQLGLCTEGIFLMSNHTIVAVI